MMEEVLKLQNLSKHFEGIKAVDEVSINILPQTIVGLFGDNGAGKTTLFNLINGFEMPDSGHIIFNGKEITRKSVLQRAQMGMGRLFQNPRIFLEVNVLDNLLAASRHSTGHHLFNYLFKSRTIREEDASNRRKAAEILDHFSLRSKVELNAYELSFGEKKLLSLGCLLMNNSQFILLDELTSGINEKMIEQLNSIILDLNKSGITFLMIEHDREMMKETCDQIYEIRNGKLLTT